MKLNSKYFDQIRVAPRREREAEPAHRRHPPCQWKGCDKPGSHKAPKGRGRDGEYFHFCIDHVRHYNASYNYFDGMSDAEVREFQKDAMTGHRPTWRMGTGKSDETSAARSAAASAEAPGAGGFYAWRARKAREEAQQGRRSLRPIEKKSLTTLGLGEGATKDDIKSRFKELVKVHHPDANGGDTRSEDKLREIIQAYNYLKQSGLV